MVTASRLSVKLFLPTLSNLSQSVSQSVSQSMNTPMNDSNATVEDIYYSFTMVMLNAGVQVLLGRVYAGSSRRQPHHPAGDNIVFQRRLQSTLGGLLRRLRRRAAARRTNQFQNRSVCI